MVAARQIARIHTVMAEQVERFNDPAKWSHEQLVREVLDQRALIDQLRATIQELRARPVETVNRSNHNFGQINIDGRQLVPTSVYAERHGVSIPTVIRALNTGRLLGKRQQNRHWLVVADAPITKSSKKRGRRKKAA